MRTLAFGIAAVIATTLFGAIGSVGAVATPTVTTCITSMYAVLPGGALVDLRPERNTLKPAAAARYEPGSSVAPRNRKA
jgi:hypothetical protein